MNLFNYKSGRKLNWFQKQIIKLTNNFWYLLPILIILIIISIWFGSIYCLAHFISKYW